jgi:antitoxin component of MazEF toxin-antitoxin module
MALVKKLTKQGNSYSLILDRALIDLLGITPETLLELTTPDGRALHIRPLRNEDRKDAFNQALEDVNQQHGQALKRLAK